MIFFFGTRASKIGEQHITNTICNYCSQQDTFRVTTYARYFHFFWIPIFPLYRTKIAECSHCKKTYAEEEFSESIKHSIERAESLNKPKRPIWHGCGCLVIIALFVVPSILAGIASLFGGGSSDDDDFEDPREEYYNEDYQRRTSTLTFEKDSIAFSVQQCVNFSIEGIDTEAIKYVSNINDNKLLILLEVRDMKKITKSSRKELVKAIEECFEYLEYPNIDEYYIGVDGKWNMLMVKTPYVSELDGDFADHKNLYPFYDDFGTELTRKTDSVQDVKIEIQQVPE